MLSLLKHVFNLFDYDHQKDEYAKKFENETKHFDEELEKEAHLEEEKVEENSKTDREIQCSKRTGVITSIRNDNGTINNSLFFNASEAIEFHDLKEGCVVAYLAYQSSNSDFLNVMNVEKVQDSSWDVVPSEEKFLETIESLKFEGPKYFNTHQRSVLGTVLSRNRQFITVDTDYKEITVDLDAVKIEFIPKDGDRVYLNCNVQTDENFIDLAGEILEIVSVHPARTKRGQGTVKKVTDEWGVIDTDCYFTTDTIDGVRLNEGDIISADMIECERGNFYWRCLKIEVLERAQLTQSKPAQPTANGIKTTNHVVNVTDGIRFTFQNAFETQQQKIELKNNSERVQKILRIDFLGIHRNSQLKLEQIDFPIIIEPGKLKTITLTCESRFYGFNKETLLFSLGTFKIHRKIEIAVGVEEDKENFKNRFKQGRSRQYAHHVWSKKNEIIPGVRSFASRRFVANRIGGYDVPEKLRNALLKESSRSEQIAQLERLYPALQEELNIHNYTNRFQTLLFVEEVEHFCNFRQYDRERAHFSREGEYLALAIDNLAEKRPSLTIGDTVRATNPWAAEEDNRAYDGCIHKVLCNKVLLKFNQAFQNKYNGEDYRLEFYFSRYSFRKQHYALKKITQNRDEEFLFPLKITLSENVQCDADLNDKGNLMINGKISQKQWCNPNLNAIQKNAIKNILRREARAMPYIIFGPPGTGKTMTLVETILQLLNHLPSSRLLVATPSNSAADLIASRLIDSGVLNPGDFVRLVSQRLVDKEIIPDHLKQYCATIDIAIEGSSKDSMIVTESGLKLKCQMKYLGRHKVTIGTFATIANFIQMDFPKEHFTHVLVDESGQCTESEIMTSVCLLSPNSGQVILAGDPYQLGPIVVNKYAGDRGLKLSFLERLIERFPYRRDKLRFPETGLDPRLVTKLIYNYRSVPSILHSYSSLFYDSELVPMLASEGNKESKLFDSLQSLLSESDTRPKGHATFFHGIRGQNKQDSDSPSWYNPVEAKHVFMMVIQMYRLNVSPDQIGIITPYQKQVKVLRSLFAEADIAMPKIGCVEEFQGQEREIVLISTVRSSKDFFQMDMKYALGFACSAKRMNVAISRARALLFIYGNPHLLSQTDKWRSLIKYCVKNDAYIGCDLPDNIASE